ncbi:hypothetical protein SUGI_0089390 [Cryptomeria japonica]|nr:hypothetical protein SUGI_0089390 [Cryptomeria japonica]
MGMSGLHAVIVPFLAQGTINPLINLAQLLSSRGVFITFVNMEWSHKCMSKAAHNDDEPTFKFLTNPDGLPPDHGRLANLAEYVIAVEHLGPVLEQHLLSSLSDGKTPPITCIITENFMSCTHEVAKKLGVPRRADKVITCLPGNLPPLFLSDLFSFYRATDTSGVLFQWALRESQFQSKLDYVLVNTFDELEPPEMVSALSCNGCPALADDSCLKLLDAQEPASVIYVSFGSIAVKSNEQLEELAIGLEKSQHPFLWVLRMDIAGGMPATLPEVFEERTKDRGLIVKWAPQVKVLSHPSVGGFLSNCGWNLLIMASFDSCSS